MARRRLREDDRGQLMILAAVLLVIGLIALAGMVSRVNQLGSQTAVEADKPILNEIPPLADAIESAVSNLTAQRSVTVTRTASSATITFTSGVITSADVGLAIVGTGIPAGTRIIAVPTSTTATLDAQASSAGSGSVAIGSFALSTTTTPTAEAAVIAILEQLQAVETGHGFVMDYELTCTGVTDRATGTGGDPDEGLAIVHLSDGTVWVEVRTTSYFARSTCVSVYG